MHIVSMPLALLVSVVVAAVVGDARPDAQAAARGRTTATTGEWHAHDSISRVPAHAPARALVKWPRGRGLKATAMAMGEQQEPPPPGSCGYDKVTALPGKNIVGDDLVFFVSPSAQDCLQRCCGDGLCDGFTFTTHQPSSNPPHKPCPPGTPCCWLKHARDDKPLRTEAGGVNLTSAFVQHPPAPPPAPPMPPNRPDLVPAVTDCRVRGVALALAAKHRPDAVAAVHDALQMDALCNTTAPLHRAPRPFSTGSLSSSANHHSATASTAVYVDGDIGSDENAGTETAPVRTVERALVLTRSSPGAAFVFIKATATPYELSSPLKLGPEDSGLTLTSFGEPGDRAVISGGKRVRPQWQHVTLPGRNASLRVYMATNVTGNFTTLSVRGKRQVLARHPNADTETSLFPEGTNTYAATWAMPPNAAAADTRRVISSPNRTEWVEMFGTGTTGGGGSMAAFYEYVDGGSAERFTPPVCPGPPRSCCSNNFPYCGVPGSVSFNATVALGPGVAATLMHNRTASWTPSPLMAVHGWWTHPVWYNLVFGVGAVSSNPQTGVMTLNLSRGGNQAAQGAKTLQNWWIEGDLGLLDSDGEWFHDGDTLWYALNGTDSEPPEEVVVSEHLSLINVVGTAENPVHDVRVTDVDFAYTATGWFEPFEALGGGDQAIHRGGAVFAEGVERFTLTNADFSSVGGNGVVISGYSRDSVVANCTLVRFGAAAIVVAGRANLIDLTGPTFPINTTIANNVAFDGGVYLKGYFGPLVLAKQKSAHIVGNVFFNCPRAAMLFNDGAFGGDVIESNLGFNTNRETTDTGVVYTYDRLVFEFLDPNGHRTVVPQLRTLRNNMFLANYATIWPIDHDDGSSFYVDQDNVLVYAGTKSYLGGHTMITRGNLILWPNLAGWGSAAMLYKAVANASGYNEYWSNNTVLLGDAPPGTRPGYLDQDPCDLDGTANPPIPSLILSDNHIFMPPSCIASNCAAVHCGQRLTFAEWQKAGHDTGSTVSSRVPTDDELVQHAKTLLGLE